MVNDIPVYSYMSLHNPDGRFWGWRLGGGFGNRFKPRDPAHPELLRSKSPRELPDYRRGWVDGGPKYALDLEGTRQALVDVAAAQWDAYGTVRQRHPSALGRSTFFRRINSGTAGSLSFSRATDADPDAPDYTMEEAREDYRAQPFVIEWEQIHGRRPRMCPIDQFGDDRAAYLLETRDMALSAHALLTMDGDWFETDLSAELRLDGRPTVGEVAHRHLLNQYVDELPEDAWLAIAEVHN